MKLPEGISVGVTATRAWPVQATAPLQQPPGAPAAARGELNEARHCKANRTWGS